MTFKGPLSISSIEDDQRQNPSSADTICQVCGDNARIINYGALSCSSCKTFFRRHGFHIKNDFSCHFNGNCHITKETRKYCTPCRFAKCLTIGMSRDLIRKEDLYEKYRSKNKARLKLASKKVISLPQPRPLNLLLDDNSSLTSMNWTLLSNIVHAFHTYDCILDTKKMVNFVALSSPNSQGDMENTLNMIANIFQSLQAFIKSTPDFRVMTTSEQCSLIQRNMQGIWTFLAVFVFRESGVFDNFNTENVLRPVYGSENVHKTKLISLRIDPDSTLFKLMFAATVFSSNCFTINYENNVANDSLLNGTFRLFGSQNVYAELLWKYMIYKYGYWESVRRFDALIKIVLDGINLTSSIYDNNKVHQNFSHELSEMSERLLKLHTPQNEPLWGKNYYQNN